MTTKVYHSDTNTNQKHTMEQTVGEIIDALSKFDRNTRIADECTLQFKYDGRRCRLLIEQLEKAPILEHAVCDE